VIPEVIGEEMNENDTGTHSDKFYEPVILNEKENEDFSSVKEN